MYYKELAELVVSEEFPQHTVTDVAVGKDGTLEVELQYSGNEEEYTLVTSFPVWNVLQAIAVRLNTMRTETTEEIKGAMELHNYLASHCNCGGTNK